MDENRRLVRRILSGALLLAVALAAGGSVFSGASFALSVLVGAGLACGSFFLLQRDIRQMMERLVQDSTLGGMEQARFLLKALGRFTVLALLLFAIAAKMAIHPLGLILGLTSLVPSVTIAALAGKRKRLSGIP